MRKPKEWPNGLGFDIRTSKGEWEVLRPTPKGVTFRARFIPRGERFPSRYGEGLTSEAAIDGAQRVE